MPKLTRSQELKYIKKTNDLYDKIFDIIQILTELDLVEYDYDKPIDYNSYTNGWDRYTLLWDKANPQQQTLMRRYKDYKTYYSQLMRVRFE